MPTTGRIIKKPSDMDKGMQNFLPKIKTQKGTPAKMGSIPRIQFPMISDRELQARNLDGMYQRHSCLKPTVSRSKDLTVE